MATGPDPGCSSTTPQSTNVDELDHQLPPSLEVLRLRLLRAAGGAAAATGSLQRAPEVLRLPTPPKHGKNTLCPKAHEKDAAEARQIHSAPKSAHKKAHSGRQSTAKSTLNPNAHLKKTLCRQSTAKTTATALAALAAFCLVLYGFGLVSAVFLVLCCFLYFVMVSLESRSSCSHPR